MNGLLQEALSRSAARAPDSTAIVHGGQSLSYRALEEESNRLARLLSAAGCRRGDRVGILMPKQPAAIVAMLAALKAEAAYVPFDPSEPPARLATMLAAAECRCLLAAGPVGRTLQSALAIAKLRPAPAIGWIGEVVEPDAGIAIAFRRRDLEAFAPTPPPCATRPSHLAHILFTSGSTGIPKGVMLTHEGVLAFLRWALGYFGLGPDDRIAQHAPLRFDLSTFDVFGCLSAGAELHLVPAELNLQPGKLVQFLRTARITRWLAVPSTLNLVAGADAVRHDSLPQLRDLMFAGEVLPVPTLSHWMRRLPQVRFTNLYGPTETTIASSHYTVPAIPEEGAAPIPIGRPCDGEELLVLDPRRRRLGDGSIGDIYIAGAGLSPGYWRDPARTRAAFLDWKDAQGAVRRIYRTGDRGWRDADGLFHYVGRKDSQIKCRGYRIELGEIERALHALPQVRDGAVVAIPTAGFGGSLICCAYVPARGADLTPLALRAALAAVLPAYMLPARWQRRDALPVNASGKVDRRRLQDDFSAAGSRQSPPDGAMRTHARTAAGRFARQHKPRRNT